MPGWSAEKIWSSWDPRMFTAYALGSSAARPAPWLQVAGIGVWLTWCMDEGMEEL